MLHNFENLGAEFWQTVNDIKLCIAKLYCPLL